MASTYVTPGIYIEEIATLPRSVAQVPTAIPAFIGYTQLHHDLNGADLTNVPTRIESMLEYEMFFGLGQNEDNLQVKYEETQDTNHVTTKEVFTVSINGPASQHNMFYALEAYFANGGGPCYIVSIGSYKALGTQPGIADFTNAAGAGLEAVEKEDEPTILVFPEAQNLSAADYNTLMNDAIGQCHDLQSRFVIMDIHDTGTTLVTSGQINAAATTFRGGVTPPDEALRYGGAYFPNIVTNLPYSYDETKVSVVHTVNGVAGPLDGKKLSDLATGANSNTAAYNKLVKAVDGNPITLPPSSFVAGVYCSVDKDRGVWKAPANVPLNLAIDLTCKLTDEIQGGLNVDPATGKSINCLRVFTGRGILVWGARTLAGNDNEWRYVNVRRFFTMVEQSCKLATQPFVFEPNDAGTWVKVQAMIENFLTTLWRQGALQGAKPEQAFYVSVGLGKTMSALDILEGRLIVEIGMAAVRPAEFIVMRFMHKLAES